MSHCRLIHIAMLPLAITACYAAEPMQMHGENAAAIYNEAFKLLRHGDWRPWTNESELKNGDLEMIAIHENNMALLSLNKNALDMLAAASKMNDLHWSDTSSLDWYDRLLSFSLGARLLAWRAEKYHLEELLDECVSDMQTALRLINHMLCANAADIKLLHLYVGLDLYNHVLSNIMRFDLPVSHFDQYFCIPTIEQVKCVYERDVLAGINDLNAMLVKADANEITAFLSDWPCFDEEAKAYIKNASTVQLIGIISATIGIMNEKMQCAFNSLSFHRESLINNCWNGDHIYSHSQLENQNSREFAMANSLAISFFPLHDFFLDKIIKLFELINSCSLISLEE